MNYKSSQEVVDAFITQYFINKNIDGFLAYLSEDVEWIGIDSEIPFHSKEEVHNSLISNYKFIINYAEFELKSITSKQLGETYAVYYVEGVHAFKHIHYTNIDIRATLILEKTSDKWLISNVHISTPNKIDSTISYKDAIEDSPVGVYIGECSSRNSIYSNQSAAHILRFKKDTRASGKSVVDFLKSNNRKPLLTQEEVDDLSFDLYKEFLYSYEDQYYGIKAKKIYWDHKEAYIMYITDITSDYKNNIELKSLINQVPIGIAIYDIDEDETSLKYINDAYFEMIGQVRDDREMYSGTNHLNAVFRDDVSNINSMVNRLREGSEKETTRYRVKVNDQTKWIQLSANVILRVGTYLKVYASFTDCDSMMRAEEEIRNVRRREENMLSSIPGGTAIYRLKKDGRITTDYVSESLANMFGYERDEYLAYVKDDASVNVSLGDMKRTIDTIKVSMLNKESVSTYYSILNKDNKPIMNRFDANIFDTDLNEDDQAVICAVHTIVSDAAKQAINEQKLYLDLLDALDIALFEWDSKNGFYSTENYNKYEMSKQSHELILANKADLSVIHPDDIDILYSFFKKFKNKSLRNSAILRMRMIDGSYRWTEMLCLNTVDKNKKITKIIGVLRDVDKERIEQNKRLNNALNEANKANQEKTNFLSRVSHDMRTPLNGILGLASLIKENVTDANVLSDLDELEISGKYLLNLINDTLDVSRIENGKFELKPTVCDGRAFFNNIINLALPAIRQKNIKFNITTGNIPYTLLYIDGNRLSQVLLNVLGNASKFTPEGGTINLRMDNVSIKNGVITDKIIISDNGIGISEEFLPYIFNPFSQEDSSSNNSRNGTGLGMAITKQILDMSGGSISVDSVVGKGTTFTIIIKLPIASDEQIDEWKSSNSMLESNNYNFNNKRVLLCDDHPLNRKIAKRLLSSKGIIVDTAENGQIGLNMFKNSVDNYYNAILMDIRMPVMDGIEAAKQIRALDKKDAKTVPIIAMTANAFNEDVETTKKAGMNAHLSKPIDNNLLFKTLDEFINDKKYKIIPNILVVDDVEVNRVILKTELENEYNILLACNGLEAKKIIEDNNIDIVITDIQMPEMDGFELIKWIRSDVNRSKMIIIANTQFGDVQQEEELLAIGANDFIYKPTTPKIVGIRVHNSLRRY